METTRKLEAAFAESVENAPEAIQPIESTTEAKASPDVIIDEISIQPESNSSIIDEIGAKVPEAVEFLRLCFSPSLAEQRKFASNIGKSPDELADLINEAALEIMSDILLEEDGMGYFIIDDYKNLFN